jgi:hypothetical protein
MPIQRPIVVSLTAIPGRYPRLPAKVASLLRQSVKPYRIELYIPKQYRRFPSPLPSIPELPKEVTVINVEKDFGPATKLLPALERWQGKEVDILICDDDRLQDHNWVKRFSDTRKERPNDIVCDRGWNIDERFELMQSNPLTPRALLAPTRGRTFSYRLKRLLSFGLHHPDRAVFASSGYVDIFEGFLGALIPAGALPPEAWNIPDILWTVDDVWLSGMAKLNGVGIWAHSYPRPVYSNGKWDKIDDLSSWVEQGVDRSSADRMCVEFMRSQYQVWA